MITDEQLNELHQRNAQRVKEAIEKLGTKYLCHPANRIKRKTPMPKINKGKT